VPFPRARSATVSRSGAAESGSRLIWRSCRPVPATVQDGRRPAEIARGGESGLLARAGRDGTATNRAISIAQREFRGSRRRRPVSASGSSRMEQSSAGPQIAGSRSLQVENRAYGMPPRAKPRSISETTWVFWIDELCLHRIALGFPNASPRRRRSAGARVSPSRSMARPEGGG